MHLKQWMRLDLILFVSCVLFFLVFPNVDLWISGLFYSNGEFSFNANPLVQFIYKLFAKIHFVYLLALLGVLITTQVKRLPILRKQALFILCVLLLGPGVFVNTLLKDNSVGRPRPVHIQNFGGEAVYTPVFHYSGQCKKNCSFVSGHAAIGYFFMALAWALQRRYWLYIGIGSGLAIGFVRIVQGGHFLSDVIFAGWAVYGVCLLLAKYFNFQILKKT